MVHADGSYPQILDSFGVELLVLDNWLWDPFTRPQSQELLEILDDGYGRTSTMVGTQVPVAGWDGHFLAPTIADAALDRLVHPAYRPLLKGESRRKTDSHLSTPAS